MPKPWTLPSQPSVVVTGASSGIGEATAYRFARAKARLGLIARREERLSKVAERVRELGGEARVAIADVADEKPRREIVLTGKGRLVVFLQRFAPAVADWVIGRAVRVELPQ